MNNNPSNYDPSNMDQLNRSEPPYLNAYGLSEAPFSQQHNDHFFYLNPNLSEQLDLLKHYTQYGNLLLIVKGEHGIGKSSLKYRFIDSAQEEWQICEIQSDTMMDSSRLLREVAMGFGITEPPLEAPVLYEVLSSQLEYLHKESYEPILIIDDAHELPQDALQSLLFLAEHHSDQRTALRIILFCDPEIDTMLEDPSIDALKEQITHTIDLSRLNENQTAEYLRHRLAVAGFDGTSPFTSELVHKIFIASEGIPAKINEFAHQNLLDDSEPTLEEEIVELSEDIVPTATIFTLRNVLFASIAFAVIVSVLIFQDSINSLSKAPTVYTEENNPNKIKDQKNKILRAEKEKLTPVIVEKKTIEISLNEKNKLAVETKKETLLEKDIKTIEPSPSIALNTKKTVPLAKAPLLKLLAVNPTPVPVSKQRQIISISGKGFHKRQQVKVSWTDNEKILTTNQVNITSDSYMNLILNVGMQTDTWSVTVIDPELKITSNTISFNVVADEEKKTTTIIVKDKKQTNKNSDIYDHDWIKKQNKNHFTLQLLGSFNRATITNYIKKYSLNDDTAIFIRELKGKNWYTLIYGSHPTKSAAQAAAKKLPKGTSKTWARSFASILPTLKQKNVSKIKSIINNNSVIPENKEGWLWSQNPSYYTLQLSAGPNLKALQNYIKRHKLQDKTAYFKHVRNGKNWYILLYGSFNGYSKAKLAIEQLPPAVQKTRPWARSFSAIHAELN